MVEFRPSVCHDPGSWDPVPASGTLLLEESAAPSAHPPLPPGPVCLLALRKVNKCKKLNKTLDIFKNENKLQPFLVGRILERLEIGRFSLAVPLGGGEEI